jgi:DnaJ-class molecular chaperone
VEFSAFDQLQVSVTADDNEIKASYLALVRDNPPDKDPVRFAKIREAYEEIATKECRLIYLLFQTPLLGFHDLLSKLMEKTQTSSQVPKVELLYSLLKECLNAKSR